MVENTRIMSSQDAFARHDPLAIRPLGIPSIAEAREQWLRHRHLYREITPNTDLFYRDQTKPLVSLVGEGTLISDVTLEHFEAVLVGMQERGRKIAPPYRAMKAFLRWCGRRG